MIHFPIVPVIFIIRGDIDFSVKSLNLQYIIMGYISPVSCTSARDNKTTRYAGARRRLYPKTLPFGTIKVVQALL